MKFWRIIMILGLVVLMQARNFPAGANVKDLGENRMLKAQDRYWVPFNPPKSHYMIEATIDISKEIVEGKEKIILSNKSSKTIEIIGLDWSISDTHSLNVFVDGRALEPLNESKDSPATSPLFYRLFEPLEPSSKTEIKVSFEAKGLFESTKEQINLIQWYPRLWWDGLPIHDSFQVKLDIPKGYGVAASGLLNKETGYYENNGVKTFGIFLGKDHLVESKQVGEVMVNAVFTEKGAKAGRLCLMFAEDALKFYQDWLGFFPFEFLYIIPGVDMITGGYPFASGIIVIHGMERHSEVKDRYWGGIIVHEIPHEYWGEYVMDADDPEWLWVPMGIYTQREYVRTKVEWGTGYSAAYLNAIKRHFNLIMDIPPDWFGKIGYDFNNIIVHGKAWDVIEALEYVLGEKTFVRLFKQCLKEYGGKRFGYRDLWRVCEEESGENLKWFFEQWIRSNKYACYQVESRECRKVGEKYISSIAVKSVGTLTMPVQVKAVFEDGTEQVKLAHRNLETNILKFESESELKEVVLDPGKRVPMLKEPLPEIPQKVANLLAFGIPQDTDRALDLFKYQEYLDADDYRSFYRLGRALYDGTHYAEAFECFKNVTETAAYENFKFYSYVWMGTIKDIAGSREKALECYKKALDYSPGFEHSYDQYGIHMSLEWVKKRLEIPFAIKK